MTCNVVISYYPALIFLSKYMNVRDPVLQLCHIHISGCSFINIERCSDDVFFVGQPGSLHYPGFLDKKTLKHFPTISWIIA